MFSVAVWLTIFGLTAGGATPPVRVPRTCAMLIATSNTASYRMTTPATGVQFDFDGDGVADQIAWVDNVYEVGLLAIDLNGNGVIDNGKELVGGQMFLDAPHAVAALERLAPAPGSTAKTTALARHDNGFLDASDEIWSKLFLWHDLNRNGKSEPEELRPVGDTLSKIGLGYSLWNKTDDRGNRWGWRGWVELKRPRPGEPFRETFDVVCQVEHQPQAPSPKPPQYLARGRP